MITIKLCGKILNYILEVLLLNKLSVSERFVFCAAIFFVYLAVKESEISLIDDLKNTWISKLLLSSSYSSLIFNVSCGAIATFIFWFIDIFIPRHQSINRCRKYVPKWKEYLEAHSFELPQHQLVCGGIGADHMNGTVPVFPAVIRASQCLAINGNQLPLSQGVNRSHPIEKAVTVHHPPVDSQI